MTSRGRRSFWMICDGPAVAAAMQGCDKVDHFAPESHVDRSICEPTPVIQTNVIGTFALFEVARELNIARFLHVSTDEVYGDLPAGAAADEDYSLKPSSLYSASKAGADLLVFSYVQADRFPRSPRALGTITARISFRKKSCRS